MDTIYTQECPTSLLSRYPEAAFLVKRVSEGLRTKDMCGAFPGGFNTDNWDTRLYDAVLLAQNEERRLDKAIELRPRDQR